MQTPQHLPGESSTSTGVTIPRWIEVKDHRFGAADQNPQPATYYVVSPECSLADARMFAQVYGQRVRMERTYRLLLGAQAPLLVALVLAILVIVISRGSPIWFLLPVGLLLGYQAILHDATVEVLKPFDAAAIDAQAATPMLFRIHVVEYLEAQRFTDKSPERAGEAHRLMWRVCAMENLYSTAEGEISQLKQAGRLSAQGLTRARARLAALHGLILDAKTSLHALVSPPRLAHPLQRDRLVELMHEIKTVLELGLADLVPRAQPQARPETQPVPPIVEDGKIIGEYFDDPTSG